MCGPFGRDGLGGPFLGGICPRMGCWERIGGCCGPRICDGGGIRGGGSLGGII